MSLADLAELADFIFLIFLPHLNLIAKAIGSRGGQILRFLREINYSFFNASAGFVLAARNVCHNTDRNAITKAMTTATTNIQK